MILISHRGNVNGRIPEAENDPDYLVGTMMMGYDVEIDLWGTFGSLHLGHDEPQYEIQLSWLVEHQDKLWIHCKNIEALLRMKMYAFHYFWHETDTVTLTSKNYIWAYPGKQPIQRSIAVMPELHGEEVLQCVGVCSDYISKYKR